jgi:hypothetical protein
MFPIDSLFIILWILFLIVVVLVLAIRWGIKRVTENGEGYSRALRREPRDIDLRLTYKRFKELYPFSEITYQEYKKLQMERAFRRAISSEKNKRMVR